MSVDRVVVTGASRGIGAAAASLFVAAGWDALSIAREAHPDVASLRVDLLDDAWPDAVRADVDAFLGGAARVAVVHCAGLLVHDSAVDVDAATMRRVLETNVVAPARLNGLVRPHLRPGSSIVFVSSTLGDKGVANAASYVASKHAVVGLMRATTQDLKGTGVHAACVAPGFTDTEMLRAHVPDEAARAALAQRTTLGRTAMPAEIAEVILFAATHPAVNGAVLHANFGQIET